MAAPLTREDARAGDEGRGNDAMADRLLGDADEKEALSRAYVQTIAAWAGFTTAVYDFDRDGVDMRVQAGGALRPAIELQLKATTTLGSPQQGFFRYRLNVGTTTFWPSAP